MSNGRKIFISSILVSSLLFLLYQALSSPEGLPKPNGNEVIAKTDIDLDSQKKKLLLERASNNEWIRAKIAKVTGGNSVELFDFRGVDPSIETKALISDLNLIGRIPTRLIAIDTPESTTVIQPYGKEALAFTKNLIEDKYIFIQIDTKVTYDKYGRLLAHFFTLEGESVQKILLEQGYARVAYLYDEYKYVDDYKQAEKVAKRNKIKIHSIPGYVTNQGFNVTAADTQLDLERIEEPNYNDLFQAFELIEGLME
ncbi:thermonuclease family protein [Anaerobacillus sp. 1_MG-2023]|uniref:thermonuclease family protein n=1 Tax=Anaerobacillus sp. 1_MG-2023 TaxID=3062655 RepID=UPI0026E3EE72|nr:thermonuclease family protein [Anaerobacillus sp. 1_MG-2023]MDO6657488.1 thermonuclease family protein [Anaerobacillus sp. 1_MG-2023]